MHGFNDGGGSGQLPAIKLCRRPIVQTPVHPPIVVKGDPPRHGFIGRGQGTEHLVAQTLRFQDTVPGLDVRIFVGRGVGNRGFCSNGTKMAIDPLAYLPRGETPSMATGPAAECPADHARHARHHDGHHDARCTDESDDHAPQQAARRAAHHAGHRHVSEAEGPRGHEPRHQYGHGQGHHHTRDFMVGQETPGDHHQRPRHQDGPPQGRARLRPTRHRFTPSCRIPHKIYARGHDLRPQDSAAPSARGVEQSAGDYRVTQRTLRWARESACPAR